MVDDLDSRVDSSQLYIGDSKQGIEFYRVESYLDQIGKTRYMEVLHVFTLNGSCYPLNIPDDTQRYVQNK